MVTRNDKLKYEFMPSALEITETPPNKLSQTVLWILIVFIVAALAWSYFGRIDVIATARGKVVPDGNVKIVQSPAGGVVTEIKARDGDTVKKGDLLVSLDSTTTQGDVASIERSHATAKLERHVMRQVAAGQNVENVIRDSNAPADIKEDVKALASSKVSSFQVQRQFASVAVSQTSAQLVRENTNFANAQANLASAKESQRALQAAYDAASITDKPAFQSQLAYANNLAKSASDTVDTMHDRVVTAKTAHNQAQASLAQLDGNNGMSTLSTVIDQDKAIEQLEADLQRAKKNVEDQSIYAPIDGKLMSFAVNTIGGVVSSGQQLAIVVPMDTPLIIEASLQNQDIGFVHVDQRVAVKVDTFAFQRYGLLEGKVVSISPDAIQDENTGALTYKMRVAIDSNKSSKETTIPLQPGMSITSEVKTGDRRIISFFLDPLIAGLDSSLKAR